MRILSLFLVIGLFHLFNSTTVHVHLIIHAHVDAGWVRTFESIYKNTGKKILDTLTDALYDNK
jgi:ATP-dependent RNA circularization protein (DNA/RNA ligase family)